MNADDGAPLSNRHKVRDLRLRDARAPVPTARKTRADELEEPLIAVPIKYFDHVPVDATAVGRHVSRHAAPR